MVVKVCYTFNNRNLKYFLCDRWLTDLFKIGLSKEISEDDLYKCSRQHSSDKVSKRFEMLWDEEMTKQDPSLIRVTLKVYWYNVMIVGFFFSSVSIACK